MKTPNSGNWSALPIDILRSVLERLSFVDFHRAKMVCSNWYSCSKQSLRLRKPTSPWLILFQERGDCGLYNPEEDSIYETNRDLSRIRFLANSRNWFLVRDSRSNLYIMDLFSEKRIDLPPLESIKGGFVTLSRVGDKKFSERFNYGSEVFIKNAEDLRGLLWVDEKKEEYVVVWFFDRGARYIAFCKNGEDHYRDVPTRINVCKELQGLSDMVLHGGDSLYILTKRRVIRKLTFSKQEGFMDVAKFSDTLSFRQTTYDHRSGAILSNNIAVTTAGEVLLVQNLFFETTRYRSFRLYKKDSNTDLNAIINNPYPMVEVYSLGDEALLMDLGITVPAGSTLGIEPNSIYFTCDDRVYGSQHSCLDICVFNLATKKLKRFPSLGPSNYDLSLTDARWFLPS